MKRSNKTKSTLETLLVIGLILVTLTACERPPEAPLQITDISVHPDPVIGQTATLRVEVTSPDDEKDVTLIVTLPDGVKLMSGELEWNGSLIAGQPQSYEFALCVLYEGDWRLHISTYSTLTDQPNPLKECQLSQLHYHRLPQIFAHKILLTHLK
jgi:hypothetical protein